MSESQELKTINLGEHRTDNIPVYSGRPRGESLRKRVGLDRADESPQTVTVIIPEDTFAVTSSFFLGLFGVSIRKLGEDAFRQKYRFQGPGWEMIDDSIRYAARTTGRLV